MGAVFGGGSQTLFGSGGAGNFLTRLTTATAIVFMLTSLILTYGQTPSSRSRLLQRLPPPSSEPAIPEAPPAPGAPAADARRDPPKRRSRPRPRRAVQTEAGRASGRTDASGGRRSTRGQDRSGSGTGRRREEVGPSRRIVRRDSTAVGGSVRTRRCPVPLLCEDGGMADALV